MTPTEPKRVTDALDMRAIRAELGDGYPIDTEASRSELDKWVEGLGEEEEGFLQELISSAKVTKLNQWGNKTGSIVETGSDSVEVNADALSVRGAHYYDTYFQYTDHTTWVFKIQGLSGFLSEVRETADSAKEAQELLQEHCKDLSDPMYQKAAEEIPSPLIGEVDGSESPRLLHFEDENHLFAEYWTDGGKEDIYDITTGDYKVARSLERTYFRLHLESGLVEIAGDDSKGPNKDALQAFLKHFGGNPLLGDVRIGVEGIQKAKENLALLVSLDEFLGEDAKLRFARNEKGNVEADPYHSDTESERERVRTNIQLLYGENRDGWNLIYPTEIGQQYSEDEEVKVGEIVEDLEESGPFEEVLPMTVGLNREKNSIRFRTKDISPPTRRSIFHLFADELNWR